MTCDLSPNNPERAAGPPLYPDHGPCSGPPTVKYRAVAMHETYDADNGMLGFTSRIVRLSKPGPWFYRCAEHGRRLDRTMNQVVGL